VPPEYCLPITLDVGTNTHTLLDDPLYLGLRQNRVRGDEYMAFIDEFVSAVQALYPKCCIQWEDFANFNAVPILERYRDKVCTYNDDIQGTAAVAAGTLLAAINVTRVPLTEQRIALLGAGSAGCGIASLLLRAMIDAGLSEAEARRRFFAVDRNGLLVDGMPGLTEAQAPFVQARGAVADWTLQSPGTIGLLDVMANAKPTVLIGVSGQAGAFREDAIRTMAQHVARPVIFPLSNPVSRSEAAPADLLRWTEGRALIGTGSPFPPVQWNGRDVPIDQTNNSYIFPGVGLGIIAAGARRVNDAMFMAAAKALAALSPAAGGSQARLLPPVTELRQVSVTVALAVARQAIADGLAPACTEDELVTRVQANVWEPAYRTYRRAAPGAGLEI
jgi:malate dehydrogenase (oxaloacetate-decarboxylating)